jgi:hypothetical protein
MNYRANPDLTVHPIVDGPIGAGRCWADVEDAVVDGYVSCDAAAAPESEMGLCTLHEAAWQIVRGGAL